MMRRLCVLMLMVLLSASGMQADTADSLLVTLRQFLQSEPPASVAAANDIMGLLLAEGYGDEITFDEESVADTTMMTICYYAAEYLMACKNYDAVIELGQRALPLTRDNGDYTWQSETLNLLTLAHFYKTQYVEALNCAQEAYEVESAHEDYERMSSTLNTTAGIYLGARQPWQAEQYIVEAIEADAKTSEHLHANAIYGIAGEVYMGMGEYEKALDYARKAYELEMQRGNVAKAAILQTQMASTYVVMGDTARARKLVNEALPILTETGIMPSLGICYNTLADVMRLEGRYDEATRYFNTANRLFLQTGDLYNRSHSLQGLARVLSDNDPQMALQYMEHFAALKDTMYYNDMRMLLTNYSAKFHNAQLTDLNTQLTEQNADIHKTNRSIMFGAVIIVLLMLAAVGFLVYAIRLKSRSNKFLLSLQHSRENFFTNVTHEFRTPLTVILGLSSQLKTASGTNDLEQLRKSGEMIEREGSQLLLLINQLLDLSKMQANVSVLDWRTGNVVAYLNMLIETFYDYASDKGIELVYAPHENEVVMDFVPDYMTKIVNNLISNAVKFTPQGGRVYVNTCCKGQTFVLQVADNGIGIGHEQQEHIFEPFYQADGGSQAIGTGVGLSIVKQIITVLQGSIDVASSPQKGTVFTIHLPIATDHGEATAWSPESSFPQYGKEGVLPDLVDSETSETDDQTRILVIEDNRDVAFYIGSQLRQKYEIFYATNGRMGLEKAERLVPDLILTDLMMPEMDGLEFCRQVRTSELLSHIPIIIITARSTNEDLIKGIEAGADAYLTKPFDSNELQVRVDKLLEQRRLLREKLMRTALSQNGEGTGEQLLSQQDAHFIGRLTDVVYSLMGQGQSDVDSIASTLCMSPSQLRRKVQAITGKPPVAYILQIRLSNAQRLLDKNPELTMSEVAYRCGFSDQSHFSHAFQKAFGMSPSQWSKRAR